MNRNEQEFLVQKGRIQYTEKEHTRLMSLVMTDIGTTLGLENAMLIEIAVGII